MPPKRSKSKGKEEKPTKAAAQQAVMEEAAKEAEKMYLKHEEERRQIEKVDKKQSDFYLLDSSVEKERLSKERELFQALRKSMTEDEALAFREYYKHLEWEQVPSASNLPDVNSEAEINTFLSAWKDEQTAFDQFLPETQVYISRDLMNEMEAPKLRFYRGENSIPAAKQKTLLDAQFQQCIDAYRLTEAIKVARDKAISTLASAAVQRHNQNLQNVFDQIQRTMDFLSIQLLLYYDRVIDAQDGETYMRMRPEETPIIKFGQWIKVREITRSFISLLFPDLDIRLDPKSNANPKLPKALGLSKEDVSLRVVQYSFDPFSAYSAAGKEYYALNCTIKADLISFSGRPTQQGQWLMRSETTDSHSLKIESYPPQNSEARAEDPSFRLSFDVPTSICVRTGTLVVGKWLEATKEWEPCTHTTFNVQFSGGARVESNLRRATFVVSELAQYAILQEKAYDAPYDSWSIKPIRFDQAVFALEGRRRGDSGDREFRFILEDAKCKLLAPEDADFAVLRENWYEPATLFRELAQLGFNFILSDEDAKFLDDTRPKTRALENKAYADIAQFALNHTFTNSRHNKHGEDRDMALFRMSKTFRQKDEEDNLDEVSEDDSFWYSIRYRKENCAVSAFTEAEEYPRLDVLEGQTTHFNLFSLLSAFREEEELKEQLLDSNYLLRACIYQVLCIVRPLSWG